MSQSLHECMYGQRIKLKMSSMFRMSPHGGMITPPNESQQVRALMAFMNHDECSSLWPMNHKCHISKFPMNQWDFPHDEVRRITQVFDSTRLMCYHAAGKQSEVEYAAALRYEPTLTDAQKGFW